MSVYFHSQHLSHTHAVDYITLKLSVAVSICLLGSVLFTLQLAHWFPYLLTQVLLQSLGFLAHAPLLGLFTIHLATVYKRRTLRNATINNHTHTHTLSQRQHVSSTPGWQSCLYLLLAAAVKLSKKITLLRLTVSKGGVIKWNGVSIFLGVRARALVFEAFLFILPLLF
jgi:hypothetical protein